MGMGQGTTDERTRRAARVPSVDRPGLFTDGAVEERAFVTDLADDVDVTESLAQLDDPRRVLSETYVGRDRRRLGRRALVARATYFPRRKFLQLDMLILLAAVVMVAGAVLLIGDSGRPGRVSATTVAGSGTLSSRLHLPVTAAAGAPAPAPGATDAISAVPATAAVPVSGAVPTTAGSAGVATPTPPAAAPTTVPVATPASPTTPEAMGAAALTLVRYPWQRIPGYSIVFRSITEAPSPGFYGNTNFTWGQAGGVSTLYVYPGETVERLAAITAFEIGHEVDAAYVEPHGGHDQIAGILGMHPASWAPECDCAEQGYLSGWYSAAFSDAWSPGVGAWSTIAPAPTGSVLAALEPWLDPRTS
jgi:hypothetical protein